MIRKEALAESTRPADCAETHVRGERGPVRVVLVNDHLGYGGGILHGVTRYFLNVIPRLNSRGIQAEALFLRGPHPAAEALRQLGIEVTFLGRRKHDPRALGDLVSFGRRRQVEILHLAGMKSILLGRIAARRMGCRSVIHLHDTQSSGPVMGFLQRRLARWTDAALGVSDPVTQLAIAEFNIAPEIAETLPNGVPIEEFASPPAGTRESVRKEFRIELSAPVVGMVGRLSAEKQPALLIASFPALLSRHPHAVLLIVGDGPLRRPCEHLTERLGLTRSVRFAGQRQDVPRMLAGMDVVVAPSSREGFPYSALEASAAGRPVVAFRVGGMPEVVSHGESGLLATPQDAGGLIDSIEQVLTQPRLAARLAEGAKKRAAALSIESHVDRLEIIYSRLASHSPAGAKNS